MYLPEDKSNFVKTITSENPYFGLGPELAVYHINAVERKLKVGNAYVFDIESPWIHVNQGKYQCKNLMRIASGAKFVPSPCLDCYKTVVRPHNVKQLIALLELMEELQYQSKCGVEERPYVFGNYGGYFYSRGLEAGQARSREVKPLIHERIGEMPVYLKRFCTEFEMNLCPGKSGTYEQTDAQKKMEKKLFHRMDMKLYGDLQPDDLKELLVARWIRMAYSWGDITSLEFNNGEPLGPQPQIYEF